jgi:hypothetical protein
VNKKNRAAGAAKNLECERLPFKTHRSRPKKVFCAAFFKKAAAF